MVIYIGRVLIGGVLIQSWRTSSLNIFFHVFQNAEEVSFAANGITAAGLKAFDGVLQSNIVLKTLDLSGNPIGDEGAKVCLRSSVVKLKFLDIVRVTSVFCYRNIEIIFYESPEHTFG